MKKKPDLAVWFARLSVGGVFAWNIACAAAFLLQPARYAPGFELPGIPGETLVRGIGILFLMWNVSYPPVIWQPRRFRAIFLIVLAQQLIGILGETWLYLTLPEGHAALQATGLRFILFDSAGLIWMGTAFALLNRRI